MFDEAALLEKLQKIEALVAAGATASERAAATLAADRIRERLKSSRAKEPDIELIYTLRDQWNRAIFVALCRRYGLQPYRYSRQRYTTACVKAPKSFQESVLWPQYLAIAEQLELHLAEVTNRVIKAALHSDTSAPATVDEPKQIG